MNITKENNELVFRLSLTQPSNGYDNRKGDETLVLIGIIAGEEYSISHLIDMSYCGKPPQEGSPIIMFDTEEELIEVCKTLGLDIWEHLLCEKCKKVIRGSCILGDTGYVCDECKDKNGSFNK